MIKIKEQIMSDKLLNITVQVDGMEPIDLVCTADSPILKELCNAWTNRTDTNHQIMCLQVEEEQSRHIYFQVSKLSGLICSTPLPAELFVNAKVRTRENFTRLDLSPRWVDWVIENEQMGCETEKMFKVMLDEGIKFDVISEVLNFEPTGSLAITERIDRESIDPLLASNTKSKYRIANEYVEIYKIDNLLDNSDCQYLESKIGKELKRSTVHSEIRIQESRTSSTFTFHHNQDFDPKVRKLQKDICEFVGSGINYIEPTQCQVYHQTQQYRAHYDYFGEDIPNYRSIDGQNRNGQRQWSAIVYLTDAIPGSGTGFPKIREEFTPKKGEVIIWNNLYPSGNPNPYTLHAGLPVGSEKKAVLTLWIRAE